MEFALTRTIAALCAAMAGIARVLFEDMLAYVTVRDQFGRKIGTFQALQHRLADMFIGVEEVVSLAWMAALAAESNDARVDRWSPAYRSLRLSPVDRSRGRSTPWRYGHNRRVASGSSPSASLRLSN